jgi:hypothetical protein
METTLGFLMVAAVVYVLYRLPAVEGSGWPPKVALGLLIGVATMTRFELGMLLPLAMVDLWMRGGRSRVAAWRSAQLVPSFLVAVAPWLVFSYLAFGSPIPDHFQREDDGRDPREYVCHQRHRRSSRAGVWASATRDPRRRRRGCPTRETAWRRRPTPTDLRVAARPVRVLLPQNPVSAEPRALPLARYGHVPVVVLVLALLPQRVVTRGPLIAVGAVSVIVGVIANQVLITPTLRVFNDNYRAVMVDGASFLPQQCDGSGPALVSVDIGILSYEGIGQCERADAGALASPELRGMALDEMVKKMQPQFVVESIGMAQGPSSRSIHGFGSHFRCRICPTACRARARRSG